MSSSTQAVSFSLMQMQPHIHQASITISTKIVDAVFTEISRGQRNKVEIYGFAKGKTPLTYIAQHFKSDIAEQSKEFLFNYLVLQCLLEKLQENKVPLAGEPRLRTITLTPGKPATFLFELSVVAPITFKEWKVFAFKAPKRKKYKDIDRQVANLIQLEQQALKQHKDLTAHIGDWVCFEITLVNQKKAAVIKNTPNETLWVNIGKQEADAPCQKAFEGKSIGESFYTNSHCFQEYFCTQLNTSFLFQVTILDIRYKNYFDLELFKRHFRLKTNKEMQKKLIEVFSFRNDISQRRAMAEDALHLLIAKHPFSVPRHIFLRQIEQVLGMVQENPDYQVYRQDRSFSEYVEALALQQAQEQILIDQLAYKERVAVTHKDIKAYVNFLKHPRMKEFLYFTPPRTKQKGHEMPLSNALLKRYCLREKTLNHIIFHLTKK